MWYEILPSAGIIAVCMAVPGYAMYYINKVGLGNHFRRELTSDLQRRLYRRDWRLTGHAYKWKGLEAIPDEIPKRG